MDKWNQYGLWKISIGKHMKVAKLYQVYNGITNTVKKEEIVDGTVIAMNKREVVVNIGYKSDGIISASEFRYNPD